MIRVLEHDSFQIESHATDKADMTILLAYRIMHACIATSTK